MVDYRGWTPLHYACIANNKQLIEQLMGAGADKWARYFFDNFFLIPETTACSGTNFLLICLIPSGRFKGGKGGANAPPLAASNVFLRI